MALIETEETNQFTFEKFAAHPFYTEVNRSLVQKALQHLPGTSEALRSFTIVDMACGTGAVTRLVAEELAKQGWLARARIIGIDPSEEALRRARKGMEELGALGRQADIEFIQGEAGDLPQIIQHADMAFFCNAIHLVADKRNAFQHVAAILAPQGIFACNSAFYNGTYYNGTERFYQLWTRRAMGWLRKEHPEVRVSRDAKAMAMQWLTPQEYIEQLQQSGFTQVDASRETAHISLDAWRDIGHYWLFIEGALPGIPLALGAQALETAVYQAGQEIGMVEVPRIWLQLIAKKD